VDNEQFKAVLDATESLSKLQRQVFVLRYIDQRSFEQISTETNKTPHHVRALASRSLARVRQICSKIQVKSDGGGPS
jgi:RNA polymerase sigma factor (sigma-70 family)